LKKKTFYDALLYFGLKKESNLLLIKLNSEEGELFFLFECPFHDLLFLF